MKHDTKEWVCGLCRVYLIHNRIFILTWVTEQFLPLLKISFHFMITLFFFFFLEEAYDKFVAKHKHKCFFFVFCFYFYIFIFYEMVFSFLIFLESTEFSIFGRCRNTNLFIRNLKYSSHSFMSFILFSIIIEYSNHFKKEKI